MRKEIFEQPRAVADSLLGPHDAGGRCCSSTRCGSSDEELRDVDKIIIIACGTSFYAGLVAKYAIEHWTRIPCEVELASEFRYRDPILDPRHAGRRDQPVRRDRRHAAWRSGTPASSASKVLAICNTNGSTIPRESDAVIYTHAGPEIGVASTKGFLTQLVACYLLGALPRAGARAPGSATRSPQVVDQLEQMPDARRSACSTRAEQVYELAREHVGDAGRCCSSAGTPATRSRSRAR